MFENVHPVSRVHFQIRRLIIEIRHHKTDIREVLQAPGVAVDEPLIPVDRVQLSHHVGHQRDPEPIP